MNPGAFHLIRHLQFSIRKGGIIWSFLLPALAGGGTASRSVEINVALRRRPRVRGGLPLPAPSARPRASARGRNPAGVRGIFKVRKLSPAQFGIIRGSLNAIWSGAPSATAEGPISTLRGAGPTAPGRKRTLSGRHPSAAGDSRSLPLDPDFTRNLAQQRGWNPQKSGH